MKRNRQSYVTALNPGSLLMVRTRVPNGQDWVQERVIQESSLCGVRVVWISLRQSIEEMSSLHYMGVEAIDVRGVDVDALFHLIRWHGERSEILVLDGLELAKGSPGVTPPMAIEALADILRNTAKIKGCVAIGICRSYAPAFDLTH